MLNIGVRTLTGFSKNVERSPTYTKRKIMLIIKRERQNIAHVQNLLGTEEVRDIIMHVLISG